MRETVPLGEQRRLFHQRWDALLSSLMAA